MEQTRQQDERFERYRQTRDIRLRNELVTEYLYIAGFAARRYAGRGVEYDDLYQVAAMALINAVDRYDPGKGASFPTYAMATLTGVLKNYFRDKARLLRLPRSAAEMIPRIQKARDELHMELMREPTVDEIAQKLDVDPGRVLDVLDVINSQRIVALDAPAPDGETPVGDLLGQEQAEFDATDLRAFLEKEMQGLSDTEKRVLHDRFWLGHSQRRIAQDLGVSQMFVSRMERRLIERFRRSLFEGEPA